jgi:predicted nucleotide-binding protein (sugar kinase/HSP70/actin superfamily)
MRYLLVNWLPGYAQAIRSALPPDSAERIVLLGQEGATTVLRGLAHTNNDACYSSIYAVGQVMEAIISNNVSLDDTAVLLPHTCVNCRAGDLSALIRKALTDAGHPRVPVFTVAELLSQCPDEQLDALAQAIVAYELDLKLSLAGAARGGRLRVALAGTAPTLFNATINNNAIAQIEAEGCLAVTPWYSDFILYGLEAAGIVSHLSTALAIARADIASTCVKHDIPSPLPLGHYRRIALDSGLVSARETVGAGWLYVGHVLDYINKGIMNIVYAHSFSCLPAHTIGRGIFRELRARYPELNIVSIEFDPGASSVNQSSRLKLLTSLAILSASTKENGERHEGYTGEGR